MKIRLLLFFVLAGIRMYSQTETVGYSVPNFAAKSPEAAAFLKYGEYPVDLSTGVAGVSIPLYTINTTGFSVPISLDYHASGIKVNQDATWVGLGWNLNFGAQIILSVRDEVDENNADVYNLPTQSTLNFWTQHPYDFTNPIFNQLSKSRVKDVYNFSSPTASGSFYINNPATNDVVVFPPDAFKVDLTGGFRITDKSGNIYIFDTTKEISYRNVTQADHYTSAWFVDRIQIPHRDIITFTYEDDGDLRDTSLSQRRQVTSTATNCGCSGQYYSSTSNVMGPIITELGYTITRSKKIRRIVFDHGNSEVSFIRTGGRQDLLNANSYLDRIEVRTKDATGAFQVARGFQFQYSYFNPSATGSLAYKSKRLKLDRITTLLEGDSHDFVYSSAGLPDKDSKALDYYGYYNGATNNDLIPKQLVGTSIVGTANRDVNTSLNQAGILKEIHYPTKGWTGFSYETNQYYGVDQFTRYRQLSANCTAIGTGTAGAAAPAPLANPGGDIFEGYAPGCNAPNPDNCIKYCLTQFSALNATGTLNCYITNTGGTGTTVIKNKFCRITLYQGAQVVYQSAKINVNTTVTLPVSLNGTCTLFLEAYGEGMHISADVQYTNDDPSPKNINSAGLRVAAIENRDQDNTLVLKKEYVYTVPGSSTQTSGKLVNELTVSFITNRFSNFSTGYCPNASGDNSLIAKVDYEKSYSISSNSRYGIEGNSVVYEYVREKSTSPLDGSNNGYTQYRFTTGGDFVHTESGTELQTAWLRGKVLTKDIYRTAGTASYRLRNETNTYFEDPARISYLTGFRLLKRSYINVSENVGSPLVAPIHIAALGECGVPQNVGESFQPVSVNYAAKWYYLKTVQSTDYSYDTANVETGHITNTITYDYENPVHLQPTRVTTTDSQGLPNAVKNYYGPDVTSISSLPGGAITASQLAAITAMNVQNTIELVQTDNLVNNELSDRRRTLFVDRNVNDTIAVFGAPQFIRLITPETVQSAKETAAFENRIRYNMVDGDGNPLEVQQENGMKTCYIWGYKKQYAVAKIENLSYSTIPTGLITAIRIASEYNAPESTLITALNNLRNDPALAGALVTTFTYRPLLGVSTTTDPKGDSFYYNYDGQGRLVNIRDKDGRIVSENNYHYKN